MLSDLIQTLLDTASLNAIQQLRFLQVQDDTHPLPPSQR